MQDSPSHVPPNQNFIQSRFSKLKIQPPDNFPNDRSCRTIGGQCTDAIATLQLGFQIGDGPHKFPQAHSEPFGTLTEESRGRGIVGPCVSATGSLGTEDVGVSLVLSVFLRCVAA